MTRWWRASASRISSSTWSWRPGIADGFLAGLAVGAVVRLGWNAVDWSPDSAFEEAFGIGVQCLFIVGLTLVALQPLSGQRKLATA